MKKIIRRKAKRPPGLSPGTLIYMGEKKVEDIKINLIDYDATTLTKKKVENVEECFPYKKTPTVSWINVEGLHNEKIVIDLCKHFDVHPLIVEDILTIGQRPKIEEMENYVFIVLEMLHYEENEKEILTEQTSFIVAKNFLITFHEGLERGIFDNIRRRLENKTGRIRQMGSDYLCYALIDAIVDNYFLILEKIGGKIEMLEEELVKNPETKTLHEIHILKRNMIILRKAIWPLREVLGTMERGESSLISDSIKIYLRDVYDHTIEIIDTVETYRDILSGMLDIYLSSLSNRTNEVMKVLTVIATIFMPLTFIAGIYGMNFKNFPEINWKYGYLMVWCVFIAIVTFMIIRFKKKGWLTPRY